MKKENDDLILNLSFLKKGWFWISLSIFVLALAIFIRYDNLIKIDVNNLQQTEEVTCNCRCNNESYKTFYPQYNNPYNWTFKYINLSLPNKFTIYEDWS